MIDITKEKLLTLTEAGKLLPGRNGGHVKYETVRRWTLTGCKGVLLEFRLIGAKKFTTAAALQRFSDALTKQEYQSMNAMAMLSGIGKKELEERARIAAAELNSL